MVGLDEAGRGCWAGPVVAAAFQFPDQRGWPAGLDDSKKLTRQVRARLYAELVAWPGATWAVGSASPEEIDQFNIVRATALAMRRALDQGKFFGAVLLVDGRSLPALERPHRALVGGDGKSPSIAAASILAKETRDRMMEAADLLYPGYDFARHKGYGTAMHQTALARLGPCPLHRRSFAPFRQTTLPGF